MTTQGITPPQNPALRKAIIAAAIGNFITWFEYASYGFLAVILGRVFFPVSTPSASLLATFAAFGISFLMAPLGALFFGRLGDRVGRKKILASVILLMSGSTFVIGLLPSYASIGILSPVLMVAMRMLQGFASGGEPGGAATFLVESANPGRRAWTVSCWHCSSFIANATASAFILGLTASISEAALEQWGWRIPFLLSGVLGVVAFYIRSQLEDTHAFKTLQETEGVSEAPISDAVTRHWRQILQTAGCIALQGAAFYFIFVYIETYLKVQLGLSFLQASVSNVTCLVMASLSIFAFARISDRIGRKPILLLGALLCTLAIYPVFLIFSTGNYGLILMGHALLGICLAVFMSASGPALVEIFPTRVRYAGFSIGFNLSVAVFGGSAAYVATYLIDVTGSSLSPALLVLSTGLIATFSVLTLRETAGRQLEPDGSCPASLTSAKRG
ncbi:MFS transporter [Pantoea sp. Ap-967]|uniref:MFS transporter n=1 Tax=Pantoea sp. Ap-967 TaxID=2608362 RepID=UPI001421B4B8|nr:MFS transporter [Pantoea sp. Ap-967]NIE75941.1 MFS transporter [Pantoea sp. Ap-967]